MWIHSYLHQWGICLKKQAGKEKLSVLPKVLMPSHPAGASRQVLMNCVLAVVEDSGEVLRPKGKKRMYTHTQTQGKNQCQ